MPPVLELWGVHKRKFFDFATFGVWFGLLSRKKRDGLGYSVAFLLLAYHSQDSGPSLSYIQPERFWRLSTFQSTLSSPRPRYGSRQICCLFLYCLVSVQLEVYLCVSQTSHTPRPTLLPTSYAHSRHRVNRQRPAINYSLSFQLLCLIPTRS
jgi:hypothetical protein